MFWGGAGIFFYFTRKDPKNPSVCSYCRRWFLGEALFSIICSPSDDLPESARQHPCRPGSGPGQGIHRAWSGPRKDGAVQAEARFSVRTRSSLRRGGGDSG
jgi:hypothetical protein